MQINRLFETVYLLLNKESVTAGELAHHFEVSIRTIYRDVELLSSAGIPIYMTKGKGGGVSLLPDFVLNKTVLTEGEKANILSALQAVNAVSPEETDTAVEKLSSLFGNTNTDWIEVDFSNWSNGEAEAQVFSLLKSAIIQKQCVTFWYHSGNGTTTRTVEPLKLLFKSQNWYLYGYCKTREDFRFFKLRRIKELKILDQHFERSVNSKLLDEERYFPDEFVTLTLKISEKMAYRVYDEFSEYQIMPCGSFQVQFTMPKGEWLFYYLSTFGEHCEVLEPKDIRLEVIHKLQKTLKQYS